ncbi:P-loop containing nucleoside triphosphate hydrolase protein [Syncephalastrum racemosum]|uniref:RNA helicase n=1 Tax=Syncephalastrum racemosum TaxID=13706 RepID=A0A1X2H9F0_SYNRA|nr:P-loop containing nucleoside triphosphate hydrolase protein [Syncephalastrum racemosum]
MAAKKPLTTNKKVQPKQRAGNSSSNNKKQTEKKKEEPKQKSIAKQKRQEYQKKKYKKKTEDDDDSDFEIVPLNPTATRDLSDEEDQSFDMFSTLPTSTAAPAAPRSRSSNNKAPAPSQKITVSDDEDNDEEEDDEKFIAKENVAANRKNKKSGGFQSMGLTHPIFKAVLHKGFKVPTPIQRKCIPPIMEGQDVVGMARTGSGKTAAFLLPLLDRLKAHSAKVGARGLVLSPSRELAMQTQKVCKELGKYTDLRSCVLVGGDSLEDQFTMMASNPDILIATPGRLLHLAVEMELDLRSLEYVVFDEADRLFEMGFAVQLHEILSRLPPSRQTLLFSATLPKMLVDFAKAGLQEPTLIRLDADTKISKDLEMAFFGVKESEKEAALLYLLRNVIKLPKTTSQSSKQRDDHKKKKKSKPTTATEEDRQTILFTATKHHVDYLASILMTLGYQVSYVYGSLDQTARSIQINKFRTGQTNIMVVTDVAARGIDIPILENVINYDFCGSSKVFVHRVGRAARAGRRGWAYSLLTTADIPHLVDLELFLTRKIVAGQDEMNKENVDYTTGLICGGFPKDSLSDDVTWVRNHVANDASLEGLHKTATNALKLYNRTKTRAAAESYTRAKDIAKKETWTSMHPLLVGQHFDDTEKQRLEMISKISGFRPSETIFEVGQRGHKKATEATLIMRQRRQVVGSIIDANKAQLAAKNTSTEPDFESVQDLGSDVDEEDLQKTFKIPSKESKTNHRDDEYYISYTQKGASAERGYDMDMTGNFAEMANKAQLDLIGDDNDAMNQQNRNALRWDAKKKKFVRGMGVGSDNKKMIRTESGALISATYKSGRYDEWARKKRMSVPRTGEQELASAASSYKSSQQRRFRHNHSNGETADLPSATPAAGGKKRKQPASELKDAAQVRKQRMIMERRKAKNARPTKKKKF